MRHTLYTVGLDIAGWFLEKVKWACGGGCTAVRPTGGDYSIEKVYSSFMHLTDSRLDINKREIGFNFKELQSK